MSIPIREIDMDRFGYAPDHPLRNLDQPPRWKPKPNTAPPLADIGPITNPLEHVAMLWPGFADGHPIGCKSFFPVPSYRNGKPTDELLYVRQKVSTINKAADLEHITQFLQAVQGQPDKYISTHTFWGRRSHQKLRSLTALTVDLDLSKAKEHGKDYNGDFMAQRQDALDILQCAGIPCPNVAVHTGRGCHLYWCFDRAIPAAAHSRWSVCILRLIELLTPIGADPSVRDSARILRLVGTTNTKAYWTDDEGVSRQWNVTAETLVPQRYSFDFLADQILPITRAELTLQRVTNTHAYKLKVAAAEDAGLPPPLPRSKVTQLRVASNLPGKIGRYTEKMRARQADLELLATTAYPEGVLDGNRDKFLFHTACNLAWTVAPESLDASILAFKAAHIPSLTDQEALGQAGSAIRRALEAQKRITTGTRCDIFEDPRYTVGDARLWEEFGADIERTGLQSQIQAILPAGDIKARTVRLARKAKRQAAGADTYTGQGVRESNLAALGIAKAMREAGESLRDIAKALKKSAKTISKWLPKPTKQPEIPEMLEPPELSTVQEKFSTGADVLPKVSLNNGETQRPSDFVLEVSEIQSLTGQGGLPRGEAAPPLALTQAVSPETATVRDIDEPLQAVIAKLRTLDVAQTLALLVAQGWFVREDHQFTPRKNAKTARVHVTVPTECGGHVFELVYTDRRWYLPLERRGGAGGVDLVIAMTGWGFLKAVRLLTK